MLRKSKGELKIEIAGICCLIRAKDANFLDSLGQERYSGFLSDRKPALTVDVELQEGSFTSIYDGRSPLIEHSVEGGNVIFGSFDGAVKGRLNFVTGQADGTVSRIPERFDALLRIIYSLWLVKAGGFFLHATGVSNHEGAYVFFGASGSGKTCVARLSTDRTILSDELVAIKKENGWYRVYAQGTDSGCAVNGRLFKIKAQG